MKKIFLALTVFAGLLTSCNNDDDMNNPDETLNAVTSTFQADFDKATDVEYNKIGNDYEIDFDIDGVEHEALYTSTGTLIKYKYDIMLNELPAAIKSAVEASHANKMIDDTEILVLDGAKYYQLELENQPTDIQLVFNEDGTLNSSITYWD